MHRISVAGFQHPHIEELMDRVRRTPGVEWVGGCEHDVAMREAVKVKYGQPIEYDDCPAMLKALDCDIVALGDAYGRRGAAAIAALRSGRHVIADKPLCTSPAELAEIRMLAREKHLCVGLMLPLWSSPNAATARRLVREGRIGAVQSVVFTGQHPLNYGTRASWYFEKNMHGGTINDIAPHGIDLVEYVTGMKWGAVAGARTWNDHLPEAPHFHNGAQFLATLANGAGVMADVSYFACGAALPSYWRFDFWGTAGWLEFNCATPGVRFADKSQATVREAASETPSGDYWQSFIAEIEGRDPVYFDTEHVLAVSEMALRIQAFADRQPVLCASVRAS